MKFFMVAVLLACTLSTAQGASARVAKECKKPPCRQAIALCVRQACAGFRGIVKTGCKRAARITLLNSCSVIVVSDRASFCSDLSAGNGCAPD